MSRTHAATASLLVALGLLTACGEKKQDAASASSPQTPQTAPLHHGLTPEQAAQPLVKVGDTTITLGQFADRLGSQSPYLRARYNSPERRREFLDNMVRFELLAIEARKRGLEKDPSVTRVRRQMMVQQMMKEMFDDKGVKLSDITDQEIEAYYAENAAEFHKPAQVRASHILVKDRATAARILAQLKAGARPPGEGDEPGAVRPRGTGAEMALFRKLAKEHNLDPATKDRYGDLRFFGATPGEGEGGIEVPQPVRDAAFKLEKTGDVYPEPVQSEAGFHVVKLTGKREALERSLDDARRLIQNRLWRKRREAAIEAFVDELRKKAKVEENPALLDQVKVDPNAPAKGMPGEQGEAE